MPATAKAKPGRDDVPRFDLSKMQRRTRSERRLELPLAGVRRAAGKTQVDVSKASGITQAEVSKIENRDDLEVVSIATVRRYVEALGADFDIVARFPNGSSVFIQAKGHR